MATQPVTEQIEISKSLLCITVDDVIANWNVSFFIVDRNMKLEVSGSLYGLAAQWSKFGDLITNGIILLWLYNKSASQHYLAFSSCSVGPHKHNSRMFKKLTMKTQIQSEYQHPALIFQGPMSLSNVMFSSLLCNCMKLDPCPNFLSKDEYARGNENA